MRAARTAASICAPAGVWVLLAHDLLGLGLGRAAMFIGLTGAAAFGIGYEVGDGGAAAALFLLLAGIGLLVIATGGLYGRVGASAGLLFATLPALIGAPSAHAGGSLRERRSHGLIRAKEVVET